MDKYLTTKAYLPCQHCGGATLHVFHSRMRRDGDRSLADMLYRCGADDCQALRVCGNEHVPQVRS